MSIVSKIRQRYWSFQVLDHEKYFSTLTGTRFSKIATTNAQTHDNMWASKTPVDVLLECPQLDLVENSKVFCRSPSLFSSQQTSFRCSFGVQHQRADIPEDQCRSCLPSWKYNLVSLKLFFLAVSSYRQLLSV